MAEVYLAERADEHFEQQVALKFIQPGRATAEVVRRFEQERQIVASLNHPHIARLLDGGLTDDGRPYFAMEHIDGQPIDRYCDEQRLAIEQRLRLFLVVVRAVRYAHRTLLVHRDLKPANIYVAADGQVKLLDFGIAKLLDNDIGATRTASFWMTPEYASPEQLCGHRHRSVPARLPAVRAPDRPATHRARYQDPGPDGARHLRGDPSNSELGGGSPWRSPRRGPADDPGEALQDALRRSRRDRPQDARQETGRPLRLDRATDRRHRALPRRPPGDGARGFPRLSSP